MPHRTDRPLLPDHSRLGQLAEGAYAALAVALLLLACGRATPVSTPVPSPTALATRTTAPEPGAPPAVDGLRMTIVYDNVVYDDRLQAAWGFAAWIEYGDRVILFDTGGDGPMLLDNMGKLGLDAAQIDVVVLSHVHDDHVGGLEALLDTGIQPTVHVPGSFPSAFKDAVRAHTALVEVVHAAEILPGVHSTGELGEQIREQALVLETREGSVVVTGCAHPGIARMVREAREIVPGEIALVAGGFHLAGQPRSAIERVIEDLGALGVRRAMPTHCTGDEAIALFAEAYGESYVRGGVGQVIEVGAVP